MPPVRHWRCIVCGYIAEGDKPPEVCPVCGATREYFEPYDPPDPPDPSTMPGKGLNDAGRARGHENR